MNKLTKKQIELRKKILDLIIAGDGGHTGGDMSVVDILYTIYNKANINKDNLNDKNRDRVILSKGHCVEALYTILCDKNILDYNDILNTYSKLGSKYIGHPTNKLAGIETCSGSLGHGLSIGVGMALAAKMDNLDYKVYVIMGDGELAEGSIWEASMAASMYKLDNLIVTIDRNRLQISGNTEDIMHQDNVKDRFTSFGFEVIEVNDGNNLLELNDAYNKAYEIKDNPILILANTIKGKGSRVMENKASWHHHVPTKEEYDQIIKDLEEENYE